MRLPEEELSLDRIVNHPTNESNPETSIKDTETTEQEIAGTFVKISLGIVLVFLYKESKNIFLLSGYLSTSNLTVHDKTSVWIK